MEQSYYVFVEEKDFKLYKSAFIRPLKTIEENTNHVKMKDDNGSFVLLHSYYLHTLPTLLTLSKEHSEKISVIISAVDTEIMELVIRCEVNYLYSNVHSSDALFQLWKETCTWQGFIDIPLHKSFIELLKKVRSPNKKNDVIVPLDQNMYCLKIKDEMFKRYLSDSELMILHEIVHGKTNVQIAKDVHLSVTTVNNRVARILKKLSAMNRNHIYKRSIELNLMEMERV
ncbi:response regulator transcription factor [Bacillus sp. FJAT-44742]|uniref:response regulator transcription factor n=1 Tax=Bacillus sp. FJAT-44742 TaxID=2014005 RepID=UPI000C238DDF|nr:helix-turn-helix transcriptional regulator [Bacillus sp. FJAT-44742]